MANYNAYDNLYNTMKNGLTVVKDGNEYSLGNYMMTKAGKQRETALVAATNVSKSQHAVSAFFSYVNDKLTVKEPPAKDKTMRSFPLRTSLAAFLSAVIVCTIAITYGATAMGVKNETSMVADENEETGKTMGVNFEHK